MENKNINFTSLAILLIVAIVAVVVLVKSGDTGVTTSNNVVGEAASPCYGQCMQYMCASAPDTRDCVARASKLCSHARELDFC